MKDVVQRIESWVRWHLWIGFEKLFLFFDDPHEADSMALALTVGGTAVEIIKRDEDLLTHWARQPSWVGHQATHAREVQVRQMLNVQYAMELCRRQGIAWLLNIDSDELFLPEPSSQSPVADVPSGDGTDGGVNVGVGAGSADAMRGAVPALFASLAAAGVEVFAFANHEIIPEVVAPVDHKRSASSKARGDPFASLSLFKRSYASAFVHKTAETEAVVALWRRRQPNRTFEPGQYFLYYEHGKSAVRCDTDGSYVPPTVHVFLPRKRNTTEWDSERLKKRGFTNDDRNCGLFSHQPHVRASVLHYAIWDPHALWAKYHLHGNFPDEIVGACTKGGLSWGDMFHTHCRDFYLTRRHDPDEGRAAMYDLFRRSAMLEDPAESERQQRLGVLRRVEVVREVLRCAGVAVIGDGDGNSEPPTVYGPQLPPVSSLGGGGGGGDDEELCLEENFNEHSVDDGDDSLCLEENVSFANDDDDGSLCLEENVTAESRADDDDDDDDELCLQENGDNLAATDDDDDDDLLLEDN